MQKYFFLLDINFIFIVNIVYLCEKNMQQYYANVLLPLPLYGTFTYRIPEQMMGQAKIGHRVIVPFGRKKSYTAIITSISSIPPEGYEVKDLIMVLDDYPIIKHPQLKFWEWISDYYLCTPGDVYKAAVPAGLKIESETFIELNSEFEESPDNKLNEREAIICQLLDHNSRMTLSEIQRKTGFKNIEATINRLIEHEAVIISEKLVERYRSRKESYVRLNVNQNDSSALHSMFDKVHGARKQETALLALIELTGTGQRKGLPKEVSRAELLERSGVTTAILKAMVDKGIIEIYKKEINRFRYSGLVGEPPPTLSNAQKTALAEIHRSFIDKDITLLHGITASGKTEIYIHLISYVLEQGNQVLYLVPEIALTTQLTHRLQKVFGDKVIIYHSKFSDNERVDIWKRMLNNNSPCVIIGARSSLFLPFSNLSLIIVDEEHETSYKQQDPAPRYNARDVATVLASMHGAKTLLGSATPAVDTYYKAINNKYGLVSLTERYDGAKLPEIEIIDMNLARRKNMAEGIFSNKTLTLAKEAISHNEQVIFFLNRRGYAPLARCKQCGWVPKCENCDVSLTYHRRHNQLICHYCGATYPLPNVCPACREPGVDIIGYGTERIEDDVEKFFPNEKIVRMDLDTTRNKDGYENIIDDFSKRRSQILIGTQMVTKGLDFDGVSLVGVVNADSLINFPDFRATERAYNMLEQVSGRAGRRLTKGIVAVQTSQPTHPILTHLSCHDYEGFFKMEIDERKRFNYPPFTRLIYIYLKHRDNDTLTELSIIYSNKLRELFGTRVFGPEEPMISRIQSLYIRKIMLKIEVNASMKKVKTILRELYEKMHQYPQMKGLLIYYDVDPM